MDNLGKKFENLAAIIKKLRDPKDGCPWDKEQTHTTLKPHLIEESYEVIDAIDSDLDKLPDELGDLLLQIMLHSQIADDEGRFSVEKVIDLLSTKLIERHPHVFGDASAKTAKQVKENWEKIKQSKLDPKKGILDSLPLGLPALQKAERIGEKVATVGFDWPSKDGVINKIKEEIEELVQAAQSGDQSAINEEFGDLLFCLAQLSRKLGIRAEECLSSANRKFIGRFKKMEESAKKPLKEHTLEELESLWNEAKRQIQSHI